MPLPRLGWLCAGVRAESAAFPIPGGCRRGAPAPRAPRRPPGAFQPPGRGASGPGRGPSLADCLCHPGSSATVGAAAATVLWSVRLFWLQWSWGRGGFGVSGPGRNRTREDILQSPATWKQNILLGGGIQRPLSPILIFPPSSGPLSVLGKAARSSCEGAEECEAGW